MIKFSTFIFITTDGHTQDPEGKLVENCQVLGIEEGRTLEEALRKVREQWKGYSFENVIAYRIASRDREGSPDVHHLLSLSEDPNDQIVSDR